MADFAIADKITGGNEGGYANVSGDTGGETYAGISRKWHPDWKGWKIVDANKPLSHNQVIKHNQELHEFVKELYKKEYWDVLGGDEIEDQLLANRLYDFAVNAGHPQSIKQIQANLGIPVTGKIDEKTIHAINNPAQYLGN